MEVDVCLVIFLMNMYFFVMGCLVGYGIASGDFPKKDDPRQVMLLYVVLLVFWPLAVLGGWLLEKDEIS